LIENRIQQFFFRLALGLPLVSIIGICLKIKRKKLSTHRFQYAVLFGHILMQLIFDNYIVPQNHQH
jgi:hypothetical protein